MENNENIVPEVHHEYLNVYQINRIITLGKRIWTSLTDKEREDYIVNGMREFLDNIMTLLRYYYEEFVNGEEDMIETLWLITGIDHISLS